MRFLTLCVSIIMTSTAVVADIKVVLLGTGTPNPVPERAGAATAIIVDGDVWIVDAGPGVVRRASAAERAGTPELAQPNLSRLLITHLHSDHTLGLPDIIYSPWTLERTVPLEIWGPPGTRRMADKIAEAYSEDVQARIEGLEPANTTGWKTRVTEIKSGILHKSEKLTIEAIPVCHSGWKHALGYKFTYQGKSVVISGDTTYCPALEKAASGADLLIHEVYDAEALAKRTKVWQAYHKAAHTSGEDLGRLATSAGVKTLVTHHQLAWSGSKEAIEEQIRRHYSGPLVWGTDLLALEVK